MPYATVTLAIPELRSGPVLVRQSPELQDTWRHLPHEHSSSIERPFSWGSSHETPHLWLGRQWSRMKGALLMDYADASPIACLLILSRPFTIMGHDPYRSPEVTKMAWDSRTPCGPRACLPLMMVMKVRPWLLDCSMRTGDSRHPQLSINNSLDLRST